MTLRPIQIVGGGLAGLSLALALRRQGVPVRLVEAGAYPRHRVCGEFITGLSAATIRVLGLEAALRDARPHHAVAWFREGRFVARQVLPEQALAISRYVLDERLAAEFLSAGGELHTAVRADPKALLTEGTVDATGRTRSSDSWLGLKVHVRALALKTGLEMHLGRFGYVGLSALPDGTVNVCGLFRRRPLIAPRAQGPLIAYLRASGLADVADRVEQADIVAGSAVAVAGLGFSPACSTAHVRVGDALGMLPPFIGNGMAAAFQTAEDALDPLLGWSRGTHAWSSVRETIRQRTERRLRRRRWWSRLVHPCLLHPLPQRWAAQVIRGPQLPLRWFFHILH